jgi:hypothetical protein
MGSFVEVRRSHAIETCSVPGGAILKPIQQRRKGNVTDPDYVIQSLKTGTERASAEQTMNKAKAALKQHYF